MLKAKSCFVFIFVMVMLFVCFSMLWGNVPRLVHYQGKLTNAAGVGIDGDVDIQFAIYRTPTGGPGVWNETHWNVPVSKGLFDVLLGSINPLNLDFADSPYYLQIAVDGDALIPREQIVSEFFAFRAIYADSVGHLENAIMEGDNISLLTNDVGYITEADWDTLQAYSDTTHVHDFNQLTGTATDPQIPDDITINFADSTGALNWNDITGLPGTIMMEGENVALLDIDTLGAHSDTFHTHDFTDLTGTASDAQIPDDITIDFAAQAGSVQWGDILNIPPDIDDGDDFDTLVAHWDSLRNIPPDIDDGDDMDTMIAHWGSIRNIPPDLDDGDDLDTFIAHWDSIRDIPPDFADGNDAAGDNDWAYDTGTGLTGAVYHTGQVGIGVLSPEEQLHVEGNVKISGGMDFGSGFGTENQVLTIDSLGECDWQDIGDIGALDLPDLGDVNTVGLVDGQVLKWIAIAGEWRPANDVGGTTGADNWGTQVVISDTSLLGDGTPAESLSINWAAVTDYIENTVSISDLSDVDDAGVIDAQVLTWVEAANEWRPVSIGPGGLGDNWGTQIVQTDNSLEGDGTPGNLLAVNWDTLSVYLDSFLVLDDLQDVLIDAIEHDQVLAWDSDDSLWKPRTDNDADMDNELIDSLIWEPIDEDDTLWNTLRIVEHSIELDMFLPLDKDDLSDNSISDLMDVDTSGVEFCNLLHWDSTNWVPMSQQELFANHSIGDLGDVFIDEGDLEFGDFFIWWVDSTWSSVANVFDLLNLWADEGGYIAPVTETPGVEYVDFHIFEKDTTWGLYFYDQNDAYDGEWYGMYMARFGDAASDGYGIRSVAGTAVGVAPGSEFYGVYGAGEGGSRVYGIYGDGDNPGAGGEGYGVYGRGHDAGGYFNGPDNDGEVASLKLQSGSQYMLLDGNEIDAVDDILRLQSNSQMGVGIWGSGLSIGSSSADNDDLLKTHSIQLATDSLLNSAYHAHTGALIYATLNTGWGTGKLRTRIADDWRSYYEEDAMWVGYEKSYIRGDLGVGTENPQGKLHVKTDLGTLDQSQTQTSHIGSSSPGNYRGQSFTPGVSGYLVKISTVRRDAEPQTTVKIYEGDGYGGTLLSTHIEPACWDCSGYQYWYDVILSDPPYLTAGQVYTWQFTNTDDSGYVSLWSKSENPYPGGHVIGMSDFDHAFKTYMSDVENADLVVTCTGVGVGTDTPRTLLDVNGEIHGFGIVPIGSIIAWHKSLPGTPALPDGWVECNGQTLNDPQSPYNGVIIPDLNDYANDDVSICGDATRGRFLRGNTSSGSWEQDQSNNIRQIGYTVADESGDIWPPQDGGTSYGDLMGGSDADGFYANLHGRETRVQAMTVVWIMRVK